MIHNLFRRIDCVSIKKNVHRLPCAGGVRVLAAERAILRIAYVVRNLSVGVPGGTVLAVEQAILRTAYVVRNPSVGVPGGTVLAAEARI